MKLRPADFRKIRNSTVAAVLMAVVGATSLYFTSDAKKNAQLAQKNSARQRAELDTKLKQVRDEESEIKEKSIIFGKLRERGVIGDEQRLEWVELLKSIRDKHQLLELEYEISPQHPLEGASTNDFAYYASTMKLQLKLLHEEDLLRLLGDLRNQAKALIAVKSCNVSRLAPTPEERATSHANLAATCEIDWITLRDLSKN